MTVLTKKWLKEAKRPPGIKPRLLTPRAAEKRRKEGFRPVLTVKGRERRPVLRCFLRKEQKQPLLTVFKPRPRQD